MPAFRGALLDLGGVVYIGDKPIPGAIDAIARLRDAGIETRFLTNTTRNPRSNIVEKLATMGINVASSEVFTPARAARHLLENRSLRPHLLVHPRLRGEFDGLAKGDDTAVVIGDAGDEFTYRTMNEAFRQLQDGAEFIALANNRSFRDADGALSLDAGAFVAALAFASRREPIVMGKPSRDFFTAGLGSMGCDPAEAVMIGDDIESDVGGAMAAGLAGVLVRTGKYETGDEARLDSPPSHVAEDPAAAVDWILDP